MGYFGCDIWDGDTPLDILSDFDYETWIFFNHCSNVLCGIKNWNLINTVMNVVEELPYELPVGSAKKTHDETLDTTLDE